MIWFTSDTHFNHDNIRGYCKRPYDNVGDMNMDLTVRWNAKIKPGDTVYHLGDFAWQHENLQDIYDLLNGDKHLVEGNHDPSRTRKLGWLSSNKRLDVEVDGMRLHLVHNPSHAQPYMPRSNTIILHGHMHGMSDLHPFEKNYTFPYVDVGVDCWGYDPINLSHILAKLAT